MTRANGDNPARDSATMDFYSREAPVYAASGPGGVNRGLSEFLERLPTGARILDLGCGGGRDAEAMIAAGFDVDPTDGVPEIARKAELRLGRNVRVLCFDELDVVEAYDAVGASARLLHVPRHSLPNVLARIFRALKPGGLHFASYKSMGTEGRDTHGRYVNQLSREDVVETYGRSAAWDVASTNEYLGGGYDGQQGPWVAITLRKPR
jgi:SAM-dependent methyltransferase